MKFVVDSSFQGLALDERGRFSGEAEKKLLEVICYSSCNIYIYIYIYIELINWFY
jgi:hypothetical protein